MGTPIPTDGLQMLRQLVKDVDLLKRTGAGNRSLGADEGVDGETITIPQANVTEGAVFFQDVELDEFAAVVGQQSFDGESILTDSELWVVLPSTPICSIDAATVTVEWDGYGPDGESIPSNFIRVAVHRSLDPLFDADPLVTQVGVMTLPGVLVFSDQITDTPYYYRFVLHTADGRRSQQSDTGTGVAVPVTVDQDQIDAIVGEAVDEANAYTDMVVVGAGGNTITTSVNNPSGTPKVGDLWYKVTVGGEIVGQWIGTAGTPNTWVSMTTGGSVLTNVSAGSITTGTLAAGRIGAQSITTEKLALGTFSTNLVADPSFEEPYPIVAGGADHQWTTKEMNGGYVQRVGLPNSGLFALRMGVASGDAVRIRSGIFPVVPGKSYVVSLAAAKEFNISVATLSCKVAGGATTALTEYPAGPSQAYIPYSGADPDALSGLDPIWISDNLYPYLLNVDSNADGIHDGATAHSASTVTTGTRSVTTAGQVLSAASINNTGSWGTSTDIPVNLNLPHRVTARYTGLAGTNARFRVYVEGIDTTSGAAPVSIGNTTVASPSGAVVVTTVANPVYDTYRIRMWLESASGTTTTSPTVTITAVEVDQIDANGLTNPVLEMYDRVSAGFTVPAGINYCALRLAVEGATAVQSLFVDDVSVVEVGRGGTEITAAGVRLFGADGTEVGAFVSNRPDYISVTDGLRTLASISQAGAISGQSLSIVGSDTDGDGISDTGFEVFGTEFMDWINSRPQGIVAKGIRETSTAFGSTTEFPVLEVQFDQIPGRMYRVLWACGLTNNTANGYEIVTLRNTLDGTQPTVTSPQARGTRIDHLSNTTRWSFGSKLYGVEVGGPVVDVRLLLGVDPEVGTTSVSASVNAPTELWVEDIGPWIPDTGIDRTGGTGTPPVTLKTYTTTWTSTTACCYMGNGSKDSSQGASDMKQGYSSYDGDSESLWIFPSSMVSTLAGVTSDANITKVRIYLYANFWYNNSGGTALLKRHNYSSVPGSSPSMTTLESSSSWPKPGGRWVDITTDSGVKAALRGGTFKGIGVGPAGSTSHTYYGRFNKSGAKIEVTYKK